jgi:undecaprenyl-diphosphatase
MPGSRAGIGAVSHETAGFFAVAATALSQLVQSPSHSRRAEAGRRLARHVLLLIATAAVAIVTLMYLVDAREIVLMPRRGTRDLWPLLILTDFGKAINVLGLLLATLFGVALFVPRLRGMPRARLLAFGLRVEFLFLAVLFPIIVGEIVKWIVGRGRPFVGGEPYGFNFVHFADTEAYASFPSSHAVTAFALAFAVSAVWPRARLAMIVYALLIGGSRLVLLAHHPSDVVAGALIGVVGAMLVRYWFAARRLGFAIRSDGVISALTGPHEERLKRVAHGLSPP